MRGKLLFVGWLAATSIACSVGDHELAREQDAASDSRVDGESRAEASRSPEDAGMDTASATLNDSTAPLDAGDAEGGEISNADGEGAPDGGPECVIGGTTYASGAPNPTNACQNCEPDANTAAWSSVANGTSCATGEICSAGSCAADCFIAGTLYPSGTANASNACQSCQPGGSTTDWSSVAGGTTCAPGEICSAGSCAAACFIAGVGYTPGMVNPTNACQSCQPGVSTSAWSDATDGTACGTDGICHVGACVSGCEIAGVYYATNAADPNDPCESCQPSASTSAFSAILNGTACGNGQICSSGECGTQCDIGGQVYTSAALNPSNACQSCQPGTSTTEFSSVANGTNCAAGEVCNAAICAADCFIAGTLYTSGQVNPANACQSCQPATSTTKWSNVTNGASCATGEVCSAGTCAADCFIAGTVYASGQSNPANACQTCQPATSTTLFSNVANGMSCAPGEICSAGTCAADCIIAGTVYTSGTVNASNACLSCQPGNSTTTWSNVANGMSCGPGEVCSAGACAADCFIGGVVYASGATMNSGCESCQPGSSTTMWTNAASGTTCGSGGEVCSAGTCAADCFIAGAFYPSGTVNPTNACLSCQPGMSTTAWSNVSVGTACTTSGGSGVCNAGSCNLCVPEMPCSPGPCQTGTTSCSTGQQSCGSIVDVPNGTACGTGGICCAGDCATCSTMTNATDTCAGTTCKVTCGAGFTLCGGLCVDTTTDSNACGAGCTVCSTVLPGSTCISSLCTIDYGNVTEFSPCNTTNEVNDIESGLFVGQQITISATITVTSLGVFGNPGTPAGATGVLALYNTTATGAPLMLQAQTAPTAIAAGNNTIFTTSAPSVPAGTYWIMGEYSATSSICVNSSASNTLDYTTVSTFGTLPLTFPSPMTVPATVDINYYVVGVFQP